MTTSCRESMVRPSSPGGAAGGERGGTMAELVNGYITVRTGLVEAAAAPVRRVPLSRRPSDAELRARVVRLRREGWSYRRIAQTLELRYTLVAEILDGPTIWVGDYREVSAPGGPPVPSDRQVAARHRPPPLVPAEDDAVEAVRLQHARLSDKVDALLRAAELQRSALNRLESSILGSIRTEHTRLADRILGSVKALFERLLPLGPRRDDGHPGD
jgi:hypothetical protein